jgi:hypothetical protein
VSMIYTVVICKLAHMGFSPPNYRIARRAKARRSTRDASFVHHQRRTAS